MNKKGKLELTWVGKEDRLRLEPRVLVEDTEKSYGDNARKNGVKLVSWFMQPA